MHQQALRPQSQRPALTQFKMNIRVAMTWNPSKLWVIVVLCAGLLSPQIGRTQGASQLWGYAAWWLPEGWATVPLEHLHRLVFFQIEVEADGRLDKRHGWPQAWSSLITQAQAKAVPLDLGLSLLDLATFNQLFGSEAATQTLLQQATELLEHPAVNGLHIDVEVHVNEGATPAAIARFRRWLTELAQRMQQGARQQQLSVFLPAGDYALIYDAPTMAVVNRVVLQGYDVHYKGGPNAGPLSPLRGNYYTNWEKLVAMSDSLQVPRHKVIMSFPLYGYEWEVPDCTRFGAHRGESRYTALRPVDPEKLPDFKVDVQTRVAAHGSRMDLDSGSMSYVVKQEQGGCTVGWYEGEDSLVLKSAWARLQGLLGLAFFALGYDQGLTVRRLMPPGARQP